MTKTINQKLLDVQKEIGAITKDSTNPFFHSKYFDINSLLAQVKPVLNKHGLVLLQGLTNIQATWLPGVGANPITPVLALNTTLIDSESGDRISFDCPLPQTADAQKAGSATTYFRRYALQSLLALEAEDDDANLAANKPVQPAQQKVTGVPKVVNPIPNDEI